MKKREKRVAYILRAGMTVLTIILIILFFGIMSLVSDLQGTARVVNYAGLVRGETQRAAIPVTSSHILKNFSLMPIIAVCS